MHGQRTAIRSPAATVNPMRTPLALHRQPLPTNLAVASPWSPQLSMATSEGEREAATPSPYEKTRSGMLPHSRYTIQVSWRGRAGHAYQLPTHHRHTRCPSPPSAAISPPRHHRRVTNPVILLKLGFILLQNSMKKFSVHEFLSQNS